MKYFDIGFGLVDFQLKAMYDLVWKENVDLYSEFNDTIVIMIRKKPV